MGNDRFGGEDLSVDQALDLRDLLGTQGLEVGEVKTQVIMGDKGTGLIDVIAQDALQAASSRWVAVWLRRSRERHSRS